MGSSRFVLAIGFALALSACESPAAGGTGADSSTVTVNLEANESLLEGPKTESGVSGNQIAEKTDSEKASSGNDENNVSGGKIAAFFEDFSESGSLEDRFDFEIYHRDDFVVAQESWQGDHPVKGPNDLCGAPEEKRTIERGTRAQGFNNDWIYRCVPAGKTELAHIMTSIGDTSGYSIGAFAPKETFSNVVEVRWDVNLTELGNRQFPEVKIIPADQLDFQDIPCTIDWLPCDTSTHEELGSVGVSFFNHQMSIDANDGQGDQSLSESWGGKFLHPNDPAVSDIRERRTNFFRDNGDGTLTYGIEQQDGTFLEKSTAGSFPKGDVRVVFGDHNYTPLKAEGGRPQTFSWHWDDLTVITS